MRNRFLCCLIGLLAAAWVVHADPPEAALTEAVPTEAAPTEAVPTEAVSTEAVPTESTGEPIAGERYENTQPDPNAPWPVSPIPAYSPARTPAPAVTEQKGRDAPDVMPVGGPEPPGFLPEPVATQPMESSETMVPAQPPRPRWSGLFGRAGRSPAPDSLPTVSDLSQNNQNNGNPGEVSQLPGPASGVPASPTEPLRLPAEAASAAQAPAVETAPPRPPGQFWINGEFLLWLEPAGRLATPLVTTGNATTTEPPGALGNSDTVILFSTNNELKYGNLPGARATVGGWFTHEWMIGAEASAFFVGSTGISKLFTPGETSTGVIARPFFNALTGNTSSAVVSFPSDFTGTLHVDSQSRLFGGEANLIGKLIRQEHYDVDIIVGYRFVELSESVQFNQIALTLQDDVLAFNNALLPANTTVAFFDRFATRDEFQGVQLGVQSTHCYGPMFLRAFAKFAVGPLDRIIDNSGQTTMKSPGGTISTLPGGIFVVPPANLGHFSDTTVSMVSQCGFTFGYHCSPCLEVFGGYEILVLPEAIRASDQINPIINPELIPTFLGYNPNATPHEPTVVFHSRTYWAQGINVGFQVKW